MGSIRKCGPDRRSGQVMVIFAIALLPLMLVILALAVDVGHMTTTRANLQNGSDAAALAGANVLVWSQVQGIDEATAREAAAAEACVAQGDNCPGAAITLEFGEVDEDGNFVALAISERATAVRACVARTEECAAGPVDLFFAKAVGMQQVAMSTKGCASLFANIQGAEGVMPFAVPESRIGEPGTEITFYPNSDELSGCFGLLNLDGGSSGSSEIRDWIEQGGSSIMIDRDAEGVWVQGMTGLRDTLDRPMQGLVGQPVVMIIYDQARDSGSNTEFRVTGFLAATLTSVNLQGASDHSSLTCRIEDITHVDEVGAQLYLGPGGTPSPNLVQVALAD